MKRKKGFRLKHLIVILLIFFVGKAAISQRSMMKSLDEKKLVEEQKMEELENSIDKLNFEIENKDSLEFIEKAAREDFKMVRPKEIIYVDKNKDENLFLNFKKD